MTRWKIPITTKLTPQSVGDLDTISADTGKKRSTLIRQAVEQFIAAQAQKEKPLAS